MAEGTVYHLRLHQGAAIKGLQKWFVDMQKKYIGGPANAPTVAQIVDQCLKRDFEVRSEPDKFVRVSIEVFQAEIKEVAMRLFEQNFSRLLNDLGHPVAETYRTENGQGLAAKIGPYIGDTTERDQIMELVESAAIDLAALRPEVSG